MSDRLKRILLIVLFLLFAGATAFGLYYVFFRAISKPTEQVPTEGQNATGTFPASGKPQGQQQPGTQQPGQLPTSAGGAQAGLQQPETQIAPQTILLSDAVTQQVSLSTDGAGARFYNAQDGKFYRINTDGLLVAMSDTNFPDVTDVAWAHESDVAIMAFPDGRKISYDFATKKQTTLPSQWEDFVFAPNDVDVSAKNLATDPNSRYLILTNPDGKNPRAIEPLGTNQDKTFPTYTPNNQIIAYATVGDAQGFDSQQIIMVGKNHENLPGLSIEGRGFEPLWSPSGDKVLYSIWNIANEYKPQLWISGGTASNMNENRMNLSVQTWAHKCVWADETTAVCGVPQDLPQGAGLQPSLYETLPDHVVRIDTSNGSVVDLGSPEGNPSIKDPVITKDGSTLIYTDSSSGHLYAFKLQ